MDLQKLFIYNWSAGLFAQPDYNDAKADRQTASCLVKKRGQLHSTGLSTNKRRFTVAEKSEKDAEDEGEGEVATV
jgi:hypothetical protein